jgi:tetratricopeptide (TPR) repeat protein/uncharacterized protein YdhG (YjbR/CyaY superfamily)
VDEQVNERVRNKLKDIISGAIGRGALSAPLLFVSPYIAAFGVLGAELLSFLSDILGEELAEKIRGKLGVRKYSEEDVREIFEIAKRDEDVREGLARLMNELIDEKLLKEIVGGREEYLKEISKAIEELKRELPDIKERLEKLETEVEEIKKRLKKLEEEVEWLVGPVYVRNEDELIEALKASSLAWVKERKPVVSNKLREKIEEAVKHVKKGEKVCIVGDPGIGKTTALYLACLRLMSEGMKLRKSGIEGEGVLVVDDIGAKKDLLEKLENCTTPVIASARISEWERPKRWHNVEIEPEDQRPKLREMFISMLKNVDYEEEAVNEILRRNPTPMFLSTIADYFRGKRMSVEDVSKIPENIYEYIANVINDCEDDLAVALLYCVARTRTGWLHRTQLDILKEMLRTEIPGFRRDEKDEEYGRYERLLAEFYGSYGIKHDVWRDLVTMNRERVPKDILSSIEKMDAIKRIRGYDVKELTREACKESLNRIKNMKASEAANLAKRALENFPDLSEDVFRIALGAKEDKRDFILDVIAIEAPDPLKRIEIDKAEELAYEIKAPNAEAILFGRLASHYRDLVSRDERFLPDLAGTLNNLGNALSDKGMLDEAIDRYEEALKLCRDLAEKDERYLPDLATTLNNLGNALYKEGSLDEAIDRYEEALKLCRDLAEKDERYLPYLAGTLNNLGTALSDKGSLDEAIDRYEEALKLCRDLAEKDERYLPDLAGTLNNLGTALYKKGSLDEAIDRYEEALKIRRDLAEKDERFLPDLAMALNNLGNALSDKGSLDEAIDRYEEALKLYRDLAEKDERFLPDLAGTLNNLGTALSDKGSLDEAIDRYEEALKIRRDLAEKDERFLPDLAMALNNLGTALSDKGMLDEAIDRCEEALKLYRDLAEKDERYLPYLAGTLNNLGTALSDKGMLDDAIDRCEEALKIRRDLAEKDERFLPDLAGTLNNLGNALYKKGSLDEAIDRYEEALKLCRDLAEKDERFLPDLAMDIEQLRECPI